MALTPVFPMLMQQIVTYLAGREFEPPRVVGDPLSLSYVDQPDATDAVFDTPSDQTIIVPVRKHRNQYVALLDKSREAGFYGCPGQCPIARHASCSQRRKRENRMFPVWLPRK